MIDSWEIKIKLYHFQIIDKSQLPDNSTSIHNEAETLMQWYVSLSYVIVSVWKRKDERNRDWCEQYLCNSVWGLFIY